MGNRKFIFQFGKKSVFIESITGNVYIISPEGETEINSPFTEEGLQQLKVAVEGNRMALEEILNKIDHLKETLPRELSLPPMNSSVFLGRDKDLEALRIQILNQNSSLILINGQGGIGKTSLIARYYHKYKEEYKHLAWVVSENNINEALLKLKDNLEFTDDENKQPKEKQMEILLTKLANLKKPSLLIIDNVNETTDLEENYINLNRCSNLHILVTTRISEFENHVFFKVESLSEEFAIELFKVYYPSHNPKEDILLKKILTNIDRNTLIIELLAKNLRVLNNLELKYSLTNLEEDLHQSLIKLSRSSKISTTYNANNQRLRVENPEDIILAIYDFSNLSEDEKKYISAFSILPKEFIPYDFLKRSYPDIEKKYSDNNEPSPLLTLAQKGWIIFNEKNKHFQINQVIQDVTRKIQEERLYSDCESMIQYLKYYIRNQRVDILKNHYVFQAYLFYATSIIKNTKELDENKSSLCRYLGEFCESTGDDQKAIFFYKKMNDYCYSLANDNETNKIPMDSTNLKRDWGISYILLGNVYLKSPKTIKDALENLKKGVELFEQFNDPYLGNISIFRWLPHSYKLIGESYAKLEEYKNALNYFKKSNNVAQQFSEEYVNEPYFKSQLVYSYLKLGETCYNDKEMVNANENALNYYNLGLSLAIKFYNNFRYFTPQEHLLPPSLSYIESIENNNIKPKIYAQTYWLPKVKPNEFIGYIAMFNYRIAEVYYSINNYNMAINHMNEYNKHITHVQNPLQKSYLTNQQLINAISQLEKDSNK